MTEQTINPEELLLGYQKFVALRIRQAVANKKYRETENGKIKTYEMHRVWVDKHKDDVEYKKHQNMKARARYHIRKANKLGSPEKEIVLDVSLGESEK